MNTPGLIYGQVAMTKRTMTRTSKDNLYLPLEFHGELSGQIDYLEQQYGPEGVREYLRQFASAFYAPVKQQLQRRGLIVLKERFEKVYELEGGKISIDFSEDQMTVEVRACPAVTFMRQHNLPVARLFNETIKTTYETICEGTPFAAELLEYDVQTGHSVMRFYRRQK